MIRAPFPLVAGIVSPPTSHPLCPVRVGRLRWYGARGGRRERVCHRDGLLLTRDPPRAASLRNCRVAVRSGGKTHPSVSCRVLGEWPVRSSRTAQGVVVAAWTVRTGFTQLIAAAVGGDLLLGQQHSHPVLPVCLANVNCLATV